MGWPKGKPRGPRSETVIAVISESQRRRFADPAAKQTMSTAMRQSWTSGARAATRFQWTAERDAHLREWCRTRRYVVVRRHAPAALGVSEGVLLRRIKQLGLRCRTSVEEKRLAILQSVYSLEPHEPPSMGTPAGLRARAASLRQYAAQLLQSASEMDELADAGG